MPGGELGLRWWETALTFALGLGLTAAAMILAIEQLRQEQVGVALDEGSTIKSFLAVALADVYVPTVAGEAFVAGILARRDGLSDASDDTLQAEFETFVEPIERELGEALIDYQ